MVLSNDTLSVNSLILPLARQHHWTRRDRHWIVRHPGVWHIGQVDVTFAPTHICCSRAPPWGSLRTCRFPQTQEHAQTRTYPNHTTCSQCKTAAERAKNRWKVVQADPNQANLSLFHNVISSRPAWTFNGPEFHRLARSQHKRDCCSALWFQNKDHKGSIKELTAENSW